MCCSQLQVNICKHKLSESKAHLPQLALFAVLRGAAKAGIDGHYMREIE